MHLSLWMDAVNPWHYTVEADCRYLETSCRNVPLSQLQQCRTSSLWIRQRHLWQYL